MADDFLKVFKKVQKAVNTSSTQALNRAGLSTRARLAKELNADLGIPSGRTKSRVKVIKATTANPGVNVSIGTRVLFAAQDFKLKVIQVASRLGLRFGATYQVKGQSPTQVDGAFIAVGKNSGKKIMIQRVGDSKYPTKTVLTDVFANAVEERKGLLQDHLKDSFQKNFDSNLEYNMDKLKPE